MAESNERIVQLDVRELWASEPYNFTPWLAENLHLLGQAIGLKLKLVQQEKIIGSMFLDIFAEEVDIGVPVAIENQLEWSDTDHMGRLLMYAAGCKAKVVIWVATEFMYEHAQVLNQLNECAGSNASFYGVKVEAIKKADNPNPEARLLKVVWPGDWDENLTQGQLLHPYRTFFEGLTAELRAKDPEFANGPRQRFDYRDRLFPSKINPAVGYAVSFWKEDAWVYLHIDTNDSTKGVFDALKVDRQEIESAIQAFPEREWWWGSSRTFSTIGFSRDASIDDPPEKLEETRAWMLDLLPKFKEVFEERVHNLLSELRTQPATGPDQT